MYQMMLRARNKKGFTLVEVIVVLVILAILAALLIPSMVGWIQKAQDKSAIVEARTVLLALQTIVSEQYARYTATGYDTAAVMFDADITAACTLAGLNGIDIAKFTTKPTVTKGTVTGFVLTASNGKAVTYDSTKTGDAKFAIA